MSDRFELGDRTILASVGAVACVVSLTVAALFVPVDLPAPIRVLPGLISVLFAPGYVTLVAVTRYQRARRTPAAHGRLDSSRGETSRGPHGSLSELSRGEWAVFSVAASVALVPLFGSLVSLASVTIRPRTLVATIGGYTLLLSLVTVVSVFASDAEHEGFSLAYLRSRIAGLFRPQTRTDAFLNLLLAAVIVLGGVVVAVPVPGQAPAQFTEFYVLSEDQSGEPAMNEYLSGTGPNESGRLWVGVTNREHERINYTILVQAQRAEVGERSVRVLDRRRTSRLHVELKHNQSTRIPYEFNLSEDGSGCRIALLLYAGDVPRSPTAENAHRELHLWNGADASNGSRTCSNLDAIRMQANRTTTN